jgi:hypothetical protein
MGLHIDVSGRLVKRKVLESAISHDQSSGKRRPKDAPQPSQKIPSHQSLQVTSFIGRTGEINDILARLSDPACRLLTLIGPGGIGKTRLATAVAARLAEPYPNAVYFVARHLESQFCFESSLSLYQELGDKALIMKALSWLGNVFQAQGNLVKAEQLSLSSMMLAAESGNPWDRAKVAVFRGEILTEIGRHEEARQLFQGVYLRDYKTMQARQTIAGIAAGVGAIPGVLLTFRWRKRRGLSEKKRA